MTKIERSQITWPWEAAQEAIVCPIESTLPNSNATCNFLSILEAPTSVFILKNCFREIELQKSSLTFELLCEGQQVLLL